MAGSDLQLSSLCRKSSLAALATAAVRAALRADSGTSSSLSVGSRERFLF
jgi:hypothetical protein